MQPLLLSAGRIPALILLAAVIGSGKKKRKAESGNGQAVLRPVLEDSHHWRRGIAARPFAPFVLFRGNCTAYLELKCYSSDNACC